MNAARIEPLGDHGWCAVLGERIDAALNARVHALAARLRERAPAGVEDIVPAYASLAVCFDPERADADAVRAAIADALAATAGDGTPASPAADAREIEIPVVYGGEAGPDLADAAAALGLTPETLAARHAAGTYTVAMLGFAPGFPYLIGLDPALALPRLPTPRTRVPAGSVAIGGAQTGLYPRESPGGWRLIGRTPLRVFDPARAPPALLAPGDRVRFRAVAPDAVARDDGVPAPAVPATARAMRVLRPGPLTTVQDSGRIGWRHLGVGRAGALDPDAAALANALVGNPPDAAVLELTLQGPTLALDVPVRVALCGAAVEARFEDARGRTAHVPGGRPVALPAGILRLGALRGGARAWMAIAGGIDVPPVLGSRSTDLRGGFGGMAGRALRSGDVLPLGESRAPAADAPHAPAWWIDPCDDDEDAPVRFVSARTGDAAALAARAWRVDPRSDRQGVRLAGEALPAVAHDGVSAPVVPGTIQLPPDGRPILLLADAQTTGGYPVLGHVIAADLPRLAQLRPGDALALLPVDARTAAAAWRERRARRARLAVAIAMRLERDAHP